jgi:hypothetical protein
LRIAYKALLSVLAPESSGAAKEIDGYTPLYFLWPTVVPEPH